MATAIALCRQLDEEGVSQVVASPHQLGRYEQQNSAAVVREAVARLRERLIAEGIELDVLPGADVRVAEHLPALIEADEVMTIADARNWILAEMPDGPFFDLGPLLSRLAKAGVKAVITHPERYQWSDAAISQMLRWRRAYGALVQVTAGSLLGAFGARAEMLSWRWLENGVVDVIASDAHDCVKRPPRMREACEAVCRRVGEAVAVRTMCTVPGRVLAARALVTAKV